MSRRAGRPAVLRADVLARGRARGGPGQLPLSPAQDTVLVNTRRALGTGPRASATSAGSRRARLAAEGTEPAPPAKSVPDPTAVPGRRTLGEGPTHH